MLLGILPERERRGEGIGLNASKDWVTERTRNIGARNRVSEEPGIGL